MLFSRLFQKPQTQTNRRVCAAMVVSDGFMEYVLVFLFSILKHNPGFSHDLIILHSRTFSPLSQANQDRIRTLYPRVTFLMVDEDQYARFTPDRRLFAALLKIEAFRIKNYDTVVFLDTDMLCLGDISYLFELDVPFAACPAGKDGVKKDTIANTYRRGQNFNSGVMVIGKPYLSERMHQKILRGAKSGPHADQEILNPFFRFRRIYCLDHRYNYNAIFFWTGDKTDDPGVKILHFAGEKPLERPELQRMRIWFEYRRAAGI